MKFKRAIQLSITSSLAAVAFSGYLSEAIANPPSVNDREANASMEAQSESEAMMSGTFVAAEQPTTGTARIVTENGQRYLELDSGFSTNEGPDLHVLLDTAETPPQQYDESQASRYVNLGSLQELSGSQRYPIPDVVDASNFSSVVIWCRMANATFGYASLESPSPVGLK